MTERLDLNPRILQWMNQNATWIKSLHHPSNYFYLDIKTKMCMDLESTGLATSDCNRLWQVFLKHRKAYFKEIGMSP